MKNPEHNHLQEIVKDLKLQNLPESEKAEALRILQDRLDSVIMQTLIALATAEQKKLLTEALEKSDRVEKTITEISSEIPEFSEALEQALLAEYESIRGVMRAASK